jgi:hypothetical protein
MTAQPAAVSAPRRARAGRFAALLLSLLVLFAIWGTGPTVHASTGRAEGFAVEQATSQILIGRVTLRFEPELADDAEALAARIPGWWSEIERPLALDVDDTIRITFVDHAGRVAETTGMPHWVAGVARSETGDIVIARHGPDGAPTDLEHLLKHEMAHVVLHRAAGGADLPRWFHEGVAESMAGGISLNRAQTLASAVFGPGVPDLGRLEENFYGDDGPEVAVAYAAARDLVEFLRAHDGRRRTANLDDDGTALRQTFSELRRGATFDVAIQRAYGPSLQELVSTWRNGLPARFVWYPLLATGGLPLAMVFPLVVVAWVRRRRLLRRGWARLELEDELERRHADGLRLWTPA